MSDNFYSGLLYLLICSCDYVNTTPCDSCARGVEPYTRGLPIYPGCVSVPLEADADGADSETKWLMKGACMNCHHRRYTNCSCREFSLDSELLHS
jgi:hypothetical protein